MGATSSEVANQDPHSTVEARDLSLADVKPGLRVHDLSDARPRFCEQWYARSQEMMLSI